MSDEKRRKHHADKMLAHILELAHLAQSQTFSIHATAQERGSGGLAADSAKQLHERVQIMRDALVRVQQSGAVIDGLGLMPPLPCAGPHCSCVIRPATPCCRCGLLKET